MNREIKFRAWDKKEKRMYGRMWPKMQIDSVGAFGFPEDELYTVMQYTGLLDKNGKEIYEGDIVCIDDTWTETVDVGVGSVPVAQTPDNHLLSVEFDGGEFGVYVKESKEVLSKGWYSLRSLVDEVGADRFEIIGNIYSNPELI